MGLRCKVESLRCWVWSVGLKVSGIQYKALVQGLGFWALPLDFGASQEYRRHSPDIVGRSLQGRM